MESNNQQNDVLLTDLSNEIAELNERMTQNLLEINQRSDYYRNCVSWAVFPLNGQVGEDQWVKGAWEIVPLCMIN